MVFKIDDSSIVKSVDFLKKAAALNDLLIYLLHNSKRLINSAEIYIKYFKAIDILKVIISIQIKVKNKKKILQNKKVFSAMQQYCLKKETI